MVSERPVKEAENRLAGFNRDRESILAEVERRVVTARIAAAARGGDNSLEYVLNDVAFQEIRRLQRGPASKGEKRRLGAWRDLSHRLAGMSDEEKRRRLGALVSEYAADVCGNFNPRVYRFATGILPALLSGVLSPRSLTEGFQALGDLTGKVVVDGPLDQIRTCADRGTLIVTPTHLSNMDSVVIGWSLWRSGLPPVSYGAGKNLFTNPFISFFMHNLGAYRVDRRIQHTLYKEVLKTYSTVLLERGYHQLFFPGGTRSRSGAVEKKLKLGLLGTGLSALEHHLAKGDTQRRIYVVPATINYAITLEAETLVDDFLAEEGKHRYIIEDDEFSRFGRLFDFTRRMLAMEGALVIRYGQPLQISSDNPRSMKKAIRSTCAARPVDPRQLPHRPKDGKIVVDEQRDAEYTKALGDELVKSFRRLTVLMPTHLVGRAIFDLTAAARGTRDVYRLLRENESEVPIAGVRETVDKLRRVLVARPDLGSGRRALPGALRRRSHRLGAAHVPRLPQPPGRRAWRGSPAGPRSAARVLLSKSHRAHLAGGAGVSAAATVGVIGSGAFATALAGVIGGHGQEVVVHCDDAAIAKEINETHKNERRLAGFTLPPSVRATTVLGDVTRGSRLLVLAVPSPKVNEIVRQLGEVVDGHHLLVHAIGAPTSDGARRVSDLVREETCLRRVGAIAGPALARDLADGKPCAILCASPFAEVIDAAKAAIHVPGLLHVYRSFDLPGVELSSAISGAMTIALGLADGSGLGVGPRALLVCRVVAEANRLIASAGGRGQDLRRPGWPRQPAGARVVGLERALGRLSAGDRPGSRGRTGPTRNRRSFRAPRPPAPSSPAGSACARRSWTPWARWCKAACR